MLTQPRRIAAISLAKRVASELGEEVGGIVGYAIRDELVLSSRCKILFATTGWLLRKILFNQEFFSRCTHIIIDEVHERSLDGDMLFLVLREFLLEKLGGAVAQPVSTTSSDVPRVIAMSATLDSSLICDYFAMTQVHRVPALFVGAHRFPTKTVYLDELDASSAFAGAERFVLKRMATRAFEIAGALRSSAPPTDFDKHYALVTDMVSAIVNSTGANDTVAVLVFLPGLTWIDDLYGHLNRHFLSDHSKQVEMYAIHSTTEREDQQSVFNPLSPGVTRVVLATNIAESSITIPFVRYVIDFGLHRQIEYDPVTGQQLLITRWISRSNCAQRAGRTGRTCAGTYFPLIPRRLYEQMEQFATPEMLRVSLSSTILSLKLLAHETDLKATTTVLSNVRTALKLALQPPDDATLDLTIRELFRYGVVSLPDDSELIPLLKPGENGIVEFNSAQLDTALKDSKVTQFGKLAHALPFGFDICRMVAFGARSGKFIIHALIMGIAISHFSDFFVRPYPYTNDLRRFFQMVESTQLGRQTLGQTDLSDPILALRLYLQVRETGIQSLIAYSIHIPRVKIFLRGIREIAQKLLPLFPTHRQWLNCLIAARHFSPTDELLFTVLKLDEDDIQYVRFMLAQVFVPVHGFITGKPPVKLAGEKAAPPAVAMMVPDLILPSLKSQLQDTFVALLPLLGRVEISKKSAPLPQKIVKQFCNALSRKKPSGKDDSTEVPPSLSGAYTVALFEFAHLDPLPRSSICFYPASLALRTFCYAFQCNTRNNFGYMRFPRLPETLTAEDVLSSLFVASAPASSSRKAAAEHLFFPPTQQDLPKPERVYCKYKMKGQPCSLDSSSLFSFLEQAAPSLSKGRGKAKANLQESGRHLFAVPATVQVVLIGGGSGGGSTGGAASRRTGNVLYVPAHLTLLNQSPLFFSFLLILLHARASSAPLRQVGKARSLDLIQYQGEVIELPVPISTDFFRESMWIEFEALFRDDVVFSDDDGRFDVIPALSPEILANIIDLMSSYADTSSPEFAFDAPRPARPDRFSCEALALSVLHVCSSCPGNSLEVAQLPYLLATNFGITHPLCLNPAALVDALRGFPGLSLSSDNQTVTADLALVPKDLLWRLPLQDVAITKAPKLPDLTPSPRLEQPGHGGKSMPSSKQPPPPRQQQQQQQQQQFARKQPAQTSFPARQQPPQQSSFPPKQQPTGGNSQPIRGAAAIATSSVASNKNTQRQQQSPPAAKAAMALPNDHSDHSGFDLARSSFGQSAAKEEFNFDFRPQQQQQQQQQKQKPNAAAAKKMAKTPCANGVSCFDSKCPYLHRFMLAAASIDVTPTVRSHLPPQLINKPCRFGAKCQVSSCLYKHPNPPPTKAPAPHKPPFQPQFQPQFQLPFPSSSSSSRASDGFWGEADFVVDGTEGQKKKKKKKKKNRGGKKSKKGKQGAGQQQQQEHHGGQSIEWVSIDSSGPLSPSDPISDGAEMKKKKNKRSEKKKRNKNPQQQQGGDHSASVASSSKQSAAKPPAGPAGSSSKLPNPPAAFTSTKPSKPTTQFGAPQPGSSSKPSKPKRECKFGLGCQQPTCPFTHPSLSTLARRNRTKSKSTQS